MGRLERISDLVSSWESEDAKHTLFKSKVHDQWIAAFRTKENVRYFERMLERILDVVKLTQMPFFWMLVAVSP